MECGVRVWRPRLANRPVDRGDGRGHVRCLASSRPRQDVARLRKRARISNSPDRVSRENDLVTGYMLMTGRGHGVHMRLIPMGSGYRYAGAGVWFDGLRGNAALYWGTPAEVPCKVMQE